MSVARWSVAGRVVGTNPVRSDHSEMLASTWTELLLNTKGVPDISAVLLERLDVDGDGDIFSDFILLSWRVHIDEVSTTAVILNDICNDFGRTVIPGIDISSGAVNDLTEDIQAGIGRSGFLNGIRIYFALTSHDWKPH